MIWVKGASTEVDAISQYPTIIGVCLSLTTLMVLVVILRIWTRAVLVKSIGRDDIVVICTGAFIVTYTGLAVWQTRLGLGLASLQTYSVVNWVGRPLYQAAVCGYKWAACLGYTRILIDTKTRIAKFVHYFTYMNIILHFITTAFIVFQCKPVSKGWKPWIDGQCLPIFSTWIATAAVTIFCDCVTFAIPVWIFISLRMNKRQKTVLTVLFMFGISTVVFSILRANEIRQVQKDGNNSMLLMWGSVEMNVGLSLTCVPALKALFTKHPLGSSVQATGSRGATLNEAHELDSRIRRKSDDTRRDSESEAILGCKESSGGEATSLGILRTVDVEVYSKERENGESVREQDDLSRWKQ